MKRLRAGFLGFLFLVALLAMGLGACVWYAPQLAERSFGPPSPTLNAAQRFSYSVELLWNVVNLTEPRNKAGAVQVFSIQPGETVSSISNRLEQTGLIHSARTFRAYLIWTGIDKVIPVGTYHFSASMTAVEIGLQFQAALGEVKFVVLPGWRMEEVAAALPSSGLSVSPEQFLAEASHPGERPEILPPEATAEGFLFPDEYLLPRSITAGQLVSVMQQHFVDALDPELRSGLTAHGLTVYQAVILASIIQRETIVEEEMPQIASVFYNRLGVGMKLESDPTVQYALGYNPKQGTWWTNPLSLDDLQVNSPYNSYLYPGLPPAPISNPGLKALHAVAFPAQTKFLFFRARCDGSGLHSFAETFQQHLQNGCP